MQLTDKQQDMIFAYLNNDLSEAERTEFEAELTTNELLRKEFQLEKAVFMSFEFDKVAASLEKAKENNALKEEREAVEFQVVKNNLQQAKINNRNKRRRIRRLIITGIAAACILFVFFTWIVPMSQEISEDNSIAIDGEIKKTFDIGDSTNENPTKLVSVSGMVRKKLGRVNKAIEENNLVEAQRNIDIVRNQYYEKSDIVIVYEARIHYLKNENPQKSINLLNGLIENDSAFTEDARWYLALMYLQNSQKKKARQQLDILKETSEKYGNKSKTVLKKYFKL